MKEGGKPGIRNTIGAAPVEEGGLPRCSTVLPTRALACAGPAICSQVCIVLHGRNAPGKQFTSLYHTLTLVWWNPSHPSLDTHDPCPVGTKSMLSPYSVVALSFRPSGVVTQLFWNCCYTWLLAPEHKVVTQRRREHRNRKHRLCCGTVLLRSGPPEDSVMGFLRRVWVFGNSL